jgi:hypothetical protein
MKDRSKKRHPGRFFCFAVFRREQSFESAILAGAEKSEIFHGDTQSPHRRQKLERDSGPAHRN